jgi:hypothetical protein
MKLKIQHLLMLQFILALFGCKKAPTITSTSSQMGPFTIETITEKGKTYNLNYGRVNYTNISYAVQYKGEPLRMSDKLETNTGVPGIWRVFFLKDAPSPALLLGSQSLYLVTLENDQPVIKPLFEQGYDFASIQWLDSEAGQPGEYREVFSSDEFDTGTELMGGRYMAISHAVVLDTKTFETYPYNTNNEPVEGYTINGSNTLAFSPDSTQLIYLGFKNDDIHYDITHMALLSYNFRTKATYAVPFDKATLKLKDELKITTEWITDYFEWIKQEDGTLKLAAKKSGTPPYPKGVLYYQRNKGYTYTLDPVKESMMEHLSSYIKTELKLEPAQVYRMDGDYANRLYIKYNDITAMMIYGEYGNDLVLKQDVGIDFAKNKAFITRIGRGFNQLLGQGQHQDEWLEVSNPEE